MQCAKCGRDVPLGKKKCLYCGSALAMPTSIPEGERSGMERKRSVSGRVGGSAVTVASENRVYENRDDVPARLGEKFEAALKEGGEKVLVEEQTHVHTTPESVTGTPAAKPEVNLQPSPGTSEKDIPQLLSMAKTKRREPLSRFTLAMIFFASAGLMGLLIWLMG